MTLLNLAERLIVPLMVIALLMPGAAFLALLLAAAVVDYQIRSEWGDWWTYLASMTIVGGLVSLVTTPFGLAIAWFGRRRLNGVLGVVATILVVLAVVGTAAFILQLV